MGRCWHDNANTDTVITGRESLLVTLDGARDAVFALSGGDAR